MSTQIIPSHLTPYTSPHFNGYPIQQSYSPLIKEYLIKNERVLAKAVRNHKRTSVFRFELKLPVTQVFNTDSLMPRFFDALRGRIKNDVLMKSSAQKRNVDCKLSYVWVCEHSSGMSKHYHVIIFLNNDVYNCFGRFDAVKGNMYSRIKASWASAVGIGFNESSGLVHIPQNPIYKVDSNSTNIVEQYQDVLYRMSYFAKAATKPFGEGIRLIGYSSLL